ncbi:MAG TPA: MFS transporter [Pyrinomonadaceae bacterium]|nr:MFS transporter [Pyrinomonadaceae bacterium]
MTYRRLLAENADFRRLWTGQVVSEIGDWLNNIAVLALAIQLAGEGRVGLAIAVYAIARHLPLFVFGPIAGVVVDRLNRRRVMIAADLTRAALALGFMLASRLSSLAVIYVVGAALFSISSFFNAAKRASIPNLTRDTEELLAANSISASTTAATIAVGSALGGAISTALGRDAVFVLNSLTFLVSAEMIRRIRKLRNADAARLQNADFGLRIGKAATEVQDVHGLTTDENGAVFQSAFRNPKSAIEKRSQSVVTLATAVPRRVAFDFREGLRYVGRDSMLAAAFVVAAGWGLGNGAARALYSIFGAQLGVQAAGGWGAGFRFVLERPTDFGISVLFVAMGLGGVLGAPLARRFNRGSVEEMGTRMGRSLTLDGCGLLLFSFMPNLFGAAAVLVAREMNFAIWWTAQQTLLMKRTEDAFAGRVFASYETLTTLTMVGSILVCGEVADRVGIRPVAAGGGSVVILSGLLWFVLRRRGREKR